MTDDYLDLIKKLQKELSPYFDDTLEDIDWLIHYLNELEKKHGQYVETDNRVLISKLSDVHSDVESVAFFIEQVRRLILGRPYG